MYLVETTPIEKDRLPLPELRGHLRLGTGFADDAVQDDLLERILRGAIAEVERLTGKSLIHRSFVLHLRDWSGSDRQVLPREPVAGIDGIALVSRDGARKTITAGQYALRREAMQTAVQSTSFRLPPIPAGGSAEIAFSAGYGENWSAVPGDLALAATTLGAAHYDDRQGERGLPEGVRALLSPYRPVRLARSL